MKQALVTLIFSLFALCQQFLAQKRQITYQVSGKITTSSMYCGGVEPSPEMLEEFNKPKPYIGKTLYIRKGRTNDTKQSVVLKFTADSNGKFSFNLAPGIYSIIQREQLKKFKFKENKKELYINADKKCLEDWWKKPYMLLTINDTEISGLNFNFHHACFIGSDIPCYSYSGEMPP
ncbi:MAG: hypothetical protein ABIP51_14560 [Bacteroidia bacterium]